MTPKEKANDLCEKFFDKIEDIKYGDWIDGRWDCAKESALIAVDEILSASPESFHHDPSQEWQKAFLSFPDNTHVDAIRYWQQVKEEIKSLR